MRSLKVSLPQLPSLDLGLWWGEERNLRIVSHQSSQSSSAPVGQGAARVSAWRWPRGTCGPHWAGPAHGENPPREVLSGHEAGPTGWDAPPHPRRAGPYKVSAAPLALVERVSSPVTACSLPQPACGGHPSKAAFPSAFLSGSAAPPRHPRGLSWGACRFPPGADPRPRPSWVPSTCTPSYPAPEPWTRGAGGRELVGQKMRRGEHCDTRKAGWKISLPPGCLTPPRAC